jgi:hypothetical protein
MGGGSACDQADGGSRNCLDAEYCELQVKLMANLHEFAAHCS